MVIYPPEFFANYLTVQAVELIISVFVVGSFVLVKLVKEKSKKSA